MKKLVQHKMVRSVIHGGKEYAKGSVIKSTDDAFQDLKAGNHIETHDVTHTEGEGEGHADDAAQAPQTPPVDDAGGPAVAASESAESKPARRSK